MKSVRIATASPEQSEELCGYLTKCGLSVSQLSPTEMTAECVAEARGSAEASGTVLTQSANTGLPANTLFVRGVESGAAAGAAPAPVAPAEVVSSPQPPEEQADAETHTLAGAPWFDIAARGNDYRPRTYLMAAVGLLVAGLAVLSLGIYASNQRMALNAAARNAASSTSAGVTSTSPTSVAQQKSQPAPGAIANAHIAAAKTAVAVSSQTTIVKPAQVSIAAKPASPIASPKPNANHAAKAKTGLPSAAKAEHSTKGRHKAEASFHLSPASQQPKVRIVKGVKYYSDLQ